jgi:hypothetical protein
VWIKAEGALFVPHYERASCYVVSSSVLVAGRIQTVSRLTGARLADTNMNVAKFCLLTCCTWCAADAAAAMLRACLVL